jgi:putative endonuclease
MALHNDLGRWGEDAAAAYLEQKGLRVLARDWHYGHRDLDIVATDDDGLCVIAEVKTRRDEKYNDADRAVSPQKIRSLSIAANAFVKTYHIDVEVRFDIVTVVGTPEHYEVRHVENAFLPFV